DGEVARAVGRIHHERDPDLRLVGKAEPGREHADDGEGPVPDLDGRAQGRARSAEPALPEGMTDDGDATVEAALLLLRREVAADGGAHRQCGRPARRAIDDLYALRRSLAEERLVLAAQRHHGLEGARLPLEDVDVLAVHAERAPVAVRTLEGVEQTEDAIRI